MPEYVWDHPIPSLLDYPEPSEEDTVEAIWKRMQEHLRARGYEEE